MISQHYSYPRVPRRATEDLKGVRRRAVWRRRFDSHPAGASRPMAQPVVQPPVTYVSLVSNYPSPRAKRERKPLSEVLTPNQPAVLHLFTG